MTQNDDFYQMEEDFLEDRKESRKERKRAVNTDRSKFKKSDQDQLKKRAQLVDSALPKARVLAITVDGIIIDAAGEELICTLRGALKKEKQRIKNIVAVGDFVQFEKKDQGSGVISHIHPRQSILSRADNLSRNKEQIIAVNIDQVLITCSVLHPPLKTALIDRYIIAAQKGHMQPIIVINKIDLLDHPLPHILQTTVDAEKALYEELFRAYAPLNIPIFPVSTVSLQGIDALYAQMEGKTSVFSGQSGTGKSSLINLIVGTQIRTGSLVHKTGKGAHTTTTTHLIPLKSGGFCIDTPGIRSFGLWDLQKEDLLNYFPEFDLPCRYPDCVHLNEPDCAVKKAVEENLISPLRFDSYCALMKSLSERHRLR